MAKLGEGTFSEVFRVKNKLTGKVTAMKKLKARFKRLIAVIISRLCHIVDDTLSARKRWKDCEKYRPFED
jgi:serine/threonine protein kinase